MLEKIDKKKLSKNNLFEFRDFIQTRTGLFFPESKFFAIENIIQSNFQEAPILSFDDYILYLKSISGTDYLKKLISLLTTNETYFFRGKPHFDLLERQIIPELMKEEAVGSRTISIWCAGCSTGEEPYSIAILLNKIIPGIDHWNVNILATDIDENALQNAKKGEYIEWSFRGLEKNIIRNCFTKKGDKYLIDEKYKSLVTFMTHNLISDDPPQFPNQKRKFDIIMCRNVIIYFEKKTTKLLASKFYDVLRDKGYLIVGHSEHSAENFKLFKSRAFPDVVVYQKQEADRASSKPSVPIYPSLPLAEQNNKTKRVLKRKELSVKRPKGKNIHLLTLIKERKAMKSTPAGLQSYKKKRKARGEESKIFDEAMQCYFKNNFELAIDLFLRIVQMSPENARACWMLAHIASNRGDFEEAVAWSNRSIKIDALFKEPYYTLSVIFLDRGELDEAMCKIKKAIYIDPDFILGHFVLGNIYSLMNCPLQKDKCFEMVKDLLDDKSPHEIIFEIEKLTVENLITALELKARET